MDIIFRKFKNSDFDEIFSMMKTFYNSPAVFTNGNDEIFKADIEACLDENFVFAEGYVFLSEEKFWATQCFQNPFRQNLASTAFGSKIYISSPNTVVTALFRNLFPISPPKTKIRC